MFRVSDGALRAERNYCLQSLHGPEGAKKVVGRFERMLKLRVEGITSRSHAKLKEAISIAHVQKPKIMRRYDMTVAGDMDRSAQHIAQLEKDDEARRRKRERATDRERGKRGGRGGADKGDAKGGKGSKGGLSAGFLEGDDSEAGSDEEGEGHSRRRRGGGNDDEDSEPEYGAASSSAHHRRRVDDDGDDSSRLERAQNNNDDDDAIVVRKTKRRKREASDEDDDE